MSRQDELNLALESMHFGFRAMTYRPDQRLAQLGLARVHHRLLYFVARHPGCSINELLQIMRVTKQYLNRPLRSMIDTGYIRQRTDRDDRRVRRLTLTTKGRKLVQHQEQRLTVMAHLPSLFEDQLLGQPAVLSAG